MKEVTRFGLSRINYRSDSGALLGKELERIYDFLRQHGLLITECFDSHIIICHPELYKNLIDAILGSELYPLIITSNLHCLRENIKLSIAENRVMEAVCPGALILENSSMAKQQRLPIAMPDSFDLRDLCSLFGGVLKVLLKADSIGIEGLLETLDSEAIRKAGFSQIGILETPNYDGDYPPSKATIVSVEAPGEIKCSSRGDIDLEVIKKASKHTSIWEIGEWT